MIEVTDVQSITSRIFFNLSIIERYEDKLYQYKSKVQFKLKVLFTLIALLVLFVKVPKIEVICGAFFDFSC
ncbi:hypothetical protein V3564_00140 [Bartonella sp. B12(2025)]